MQKPRDSVDVEKYIKHVSKLEEYSRLVADKLVKDFKRLGKAIIAYNGLGYLPASIHYWMKTTMEKWNNTLLVDAGVLAYFIVAYNEPTDIVFYTVNPRHPSSLHLLESSTLVGHRIHVYAVKPHSSIVENMLEKYNPYYISVSDELEASLIYSFAVYHALSSIHRGSLGRRGQRLYKHSVEGFTPVIAELLAKYGRVVEELKGVDEITVSSARILEPVGLYFKEALRRKGILARYMPIEQDGDGGNILLLYTSVEEPLVRSEKFRLATSGAKLYEIMMNTDPLEAQIYIALIAYYLAGT